MQMQATLQRGAVDAVFGADGGEPPLQLPLIVFVVHEHNSAWAAGRDDR